MLDFTGLTAERAQRICAAALREAGFETSDLDARLLLQGALACDATAVARDPDRVLNEDESVRLADYVAQRLAHKPVSRIFGQREFYGRDFMINERVLDPRADSETLVEVALANLPAKSTARILDLGTGSGCLLLTLLAERENTEGVAADVSPHALLVSQDNAARLGVGGRVRFIESDWFKNITGSFEVIISNPPYLTPGEMEFLDRNVADYDPHLALYGGADGLTPYRLICSRAGGYLVPQGRLIFEIGALQARAVSAMMEAAGFSQVHVQKDLAGRDRVVSGIWPGEGKPVLSGGGKK